MKPNKLHKAQFSSEVIIT